jgi:hypothetical protein
VKIAAVIRWLLSFFRRHRSAPCWEVVMDSDGVMCRVRWSEPDTKGRYLWVRHYPATRWGMNAVEREAARMNSEGRRPEERLRGGSNVEN